MDGPEAVVSRVVVHLLFLFATATVFFYIFSGLLLRFAFFLWAGSGAGSCFTCVDHGLILGLFVFWRGCARFIVEERYLRRWLFFDLTGWLAFDIGCIGLVDLPDLIASYRSPISHRGVGSGETTDGAKHQRRLLVDAAGVGGVRIVNTLWTRAALFSCCAGAGAGVCTGASGWMCSCCLGRYPGEGHGHHKHDPTLRLAHASVYLRYEECSSLCRLGCPILPTLFGHHDA